MNLSLFRTAEAAFAREFCHGTHGGLFGDALRSIPVPADPANSRREAMSASSPNAAAGSAPISQRPAPEVTPTARGDFSSRTDA
jgi:hypothetical protein